MGTARISNAAAMTPAQRPKTVMNISIKWTAATYDARCNLAHALRVCRGNKTFPMKNKSLLTLALLAVLASGTSAASQPQAEPIALPTYVVDAPRMQMAEQRLNASLDALRAKASNPVDLSAELPVLKNRVAYASTPLIALRHAKS